MPRTRSHPIVIFFHTLLLTLYWDSVGHEQDVCDLVGDPLWRIYTWTHFFRLICKCRPPNHLFLVLFLKNEGARPTQVFITVIWFSGKTWTTGPHWLRLITIFIWSLPCNSNYHCKGPGFNAPLRLGGSATLHTTREAIKLAKIICPMNICSTRLMTDIRKKTLPSDQSELKDGVVANDADALDSPSTKSLFSCCL